MSYVALYRQYRPKDFSEVAGQRVIVQTLQNALKLGQIGHAYLFSGPRGTGKTSIAKILAKAVNCLEMPQDDACGKCAICKGIESGTITDIIEIDAASNNGVDEIRELREKARFSPSVCRYKVYIIDEVHMLTTQAFNALLKTLEEPPKHVIFILATTEAYKIPATILSRCQRFDFRNIQVKDIVSKLEEIVKAEKIEIEDEALVTIAENAEGALRDALSLLDQTISFAEGKITVDDVHQVAGSVSSVALGEMIKNIAVKDTHEVMTILDNLLDEGKEITRIVNDLILALRDILLAKNTEYDNKKYSDIAPLLKMPKIYYYLDVLNTLQQDMKWTNQKRAYVELALIKMMNHEILDEIDQEEQIEELRSQVAELNQKLTSGEFVSKQRETEETEKTPLVTVREIGEVMNSGNNTKRNFIVSAWKENLNQAPDGLEATANLLLDVDVVAGSDNELVLSAKNLMIARKLYVPKIKEQALKLIKQIDKSIQNYYAIYEADWDILKSDFASQWKAGVKKPLLSAIDLKLYEELKPEQEAEIVKFAKEAFGDDKVVIID